MYIGHHPRIRGQKLNRLPLQVYLIPFVIITYIDNICSSNLIPLFLSNDDSLDWKDNATPESICKRVTSKVKNGSIVLFHNDAEHTPEALPNILKTLKNDGYEFVFIEDLIYKDNYEIKHDGTQCEIESD